MAPLEDWDTPIGQPEPKDTVAVEPLSNPQEPQPWNSTAKNGLVNGHLEHVKAEMALDQRQPDFKTPARIDTAATEPQSLSSHPTVLSPSDTQTSALLASSQNQIAATISLPSTIPTTMKAFITGKKSLMSRMVSGMSKKEFGHGMTLEDIPVPKPATGQILVRVNYVALNPIDHVAIDNTAPPRSIVGCDFSGIVVACGLMSSEWQVGDRIAGVVPGNSTTTVGAFAEYLVCESDLAWKPPAYINDIQATTFGVSAVAAMQSLFLNLDVPWPVTEDPYQLERVHTIDWARPALLIYAASTCTGLFAVQLAKKAGSSVIATCSPHSFRLAKTYGADAVYDYHEAPESIRDIKLKYPNITRVLDCISKGESTNLCCKAIGKNGGKVVTLMPRESSRVPYVFVKNVSIYSLFGKTSASFSPFQAQKQRAVKQERDYLVKFFKSLPNLTKDLRPPPIKVLEGGFESIPEGLEMLRQRLVSGQKLVVRLA